ncbi:hypothetical protein FQA47_011571 [Oryzias melastigma]|uniref:Uncharacterized protein n=1 Tax=Oryzias melastigma TaxID=30732 RepID=A0A834CBL3_ORYME|nr:hypothetical protein FQA47_011571 [Oryzias melastigma]
MARPDSKGASVHVANEAKHVGGKKLLRRYSALSGSSRAGCGHAEQQRRGARSPTATRSESVRGRSDRTRGSRAE